MSYLCIYISAFIYSQTLRITNICSYDKDFNKHPRDKKSWFLDTGYLDQMIDLQIGNVRSDQNKNMVNKLGTGVPFAMKYNSKLG